MLRAPLRTASIAPLALAIALAGCTGASPNQGPLQPQTVEGPCQVKKFFLLAQTVVHTTVTVDRTGGTCAFTLIDSNNQVFPSATLITVPPAHGRAATQLVNGGRSALVTYTPAPGYGGPDQFTVTIEPGDHAIAVAVAP